MSIRSLTTGWMVPITKSKKGKSKRFGWGKRKFICLKYL